MLKTLIWFLTDSDIDKEWSNLSSIPQKISYIYSIAGLLFFEFFCIYGLLNSIINVVI